MGTECLDQKPIWVIFTRIMCNIYHALGHSLYNPMLYARIVIILQSARGNGAVSYYTLIFSQHLGCTINRCPKNYELLAY